MADEDNNIVDYDDDMEAQEAAPVEKKTKKTKKGSGINASSFKDFMLKPELLRAVIDCGFEHPTEVQHECVPQALLGMDVICQAKSGNGKTGVFVLATLHQMAPVEGEIQVVVLCHVRELAFQIMREYERFAKYLPECKPRVFFGGTNIKGDIDAIEKEKPNIVVGTPGRIMDLIQRGKLDLSKTKHFILDECDRMLAEVGMRKDVQTIFRACPHEKQVMMFSATLEKEVRPICRKFCQDPMEIYVDDETKLTLFGLQQYYIKLTEQEKNRKLNDLLDDIDFNQVVIFVSKVARAKELNKLLTACNFPSICIHSGMKQDERLEKYKGFKDFQSRILVTTDIFGRGIDIEHVNIVINYDFPDESDQYLHRVGRAGRGNTKGLAVSFISTDKDAEVFQGVQDRFSVKVPELPENIDQTSYK